MQRAGIHFLTYKAQAMGIEVGAPFESDLFTPRFRYGADEWTHSFRKVRARQSELQQRLEAAEQMARQSQDAVHYLKGALEDVNYMHQTWADKSTHVGPPVVASGTPTQLPMIDVPVGDVPLVDAPQSVVAHPAIEPRVVVPN